MYMEKVVSCMKVGHTVSTIGYGRYSCTFSFVNYLLDVL